MSGADDKQMLEMRRRVREAEMRMGAMTRVFEELFGRRRALHNWMNGVDLDKAVTSYKFDTEFWIRRCGVGPSGYRSIEAIEKHLLGKERFDRGEDIVTLEDLQFEARAEMEAISGVGPKTMEALDKALEDHNLSWGVA